MLDKLFREQQGQLNYFFDRLNMEAVEEILQVLLSCKGVVFFSGVGKSGIIAEKIAVTMISTGTKAYYVSPTNALHGDLGIVTSSDVFVMLSKSGETEELLHLVPFIRNKGAFLIAVTSNPSCRLVKAANMSIYLPLERELCPFDLAPTTSTAVQLIFGDVLAVGLMKSKNFALSDYALNHPGGRIGRRASVQVADLMLGEHSVPLCAPTDQLVNVLVELSDKRCGCLIVVDAQQMLLGIFTDGDLRRSLQREGADVLHKPIEDLMSRAPKSIPSQARAWDALKLMEADQKHPVMILPVVDAGKVVGLIKMHDIIQAGL